MDTAKQQTAISQTSRGALRAGLWIGVLLCLCATSAQADRIVQIRVGNHPTYTRLVFEMDTAAGYQIQRQTAEDGSKQITVTVNAASPSREIQSKSIGIESVTVEEVGDTSVVQIRLRRSDVLLKEMILSNPPRIVLDFEFEPEVAATPKAAPKASPTPSMEAESKPEAESTPPVIAKAQPQTPVVTPEPEVVKAEPVQAETAEPVADSSPEKTDRVVLQAPVPGIDEPAHKTTTELTRRPVEQAPDAVAETDAGQADAGDRLNNIGQALKRETAAQAIPSAPKTKPAELTTPRQTAKSESPSPKSDINTYVIAGAAVGLLVVAVLAVRMFRKRAIPTDVDLPSFNDDVFDASPEAATEESAATEEDAAAEEENDGTRIPTEGFAMNDESPADDDGVQVSEENTAAYSLSEVASQTTEPETGFFNEDSEGEKTMDLDATDLPADRDELGASPIAVATDDTDVPALVQGLIGRIEGLEARIDESNEARERLERQVAAQSEELRVQRAAIARTQRALRSLSRSEEDQATEPALRDPSNPTS